MAQSVERCRAARLGSRECALGMASRRQGSLNAVGMRALLGRKGAQRYQDATREVVSVAAAPVGTEGAMMKLQDAGRNVR